MKRMSRLLALAGILGIAGVGGTFAYFNQSDSKKNIFNTGTYDTKLEEDFRPKDGENWKPGSTVNKDVTVKNNGSLFEDNLLQKLYSHQIQSRGSGIGLININERIKLMFGSDYGLQLYNEDDKAVAQIDIPYLVI